MKYTPRRFGNKWNAGAPAYVLDCFDSKNSGERYTVFFGGEFIFHTDKDHKLVTGSDTYANTYVQYLGMDDAPSHPQGVSLWGEMPAHQAAAYRYRVKHHRIRWLDLPQHIRDHVIARATT